MENYITERFLKYVVYLKIKAIKGIKLLQRNCINFTPKFYFLNHAIILIKHVPINFKLAS